MATTLPYHPFVLAIFRAAGRRGGAAKSEAKAAAARRNGHVPCRPGKQRGRPPGGRKPSVLPSAIIGTLPSRVNVVCGCGVQVVLTMEAERQLRADKPWRWVCPDCEAENVVTPDVLDVREKI